MINIAVINYITYKPPTNIFKWSSVKRNLQSNYAIQ